MCLGAAVRCGALSLEVGTVRDRTFLAQCPLTQGMRVDVTGVTVNSRRPGLRKGRHYFAVGRVRYCMSSDCGVDDIALSIFASIWLLLVFFSSVRTSFVIARVKVFIVELAPFGAGAVQR